MDRAATRRTAATDARIWPRMTAILLVTILVRLLLLADNLAIHPDFLAQELTSVETSLAESNRPYVNPFGFEASNIAHALVCSGQGFASPFGGATGPTGWIAPGVVALYAVAFALFGCFTVEAILFAFAIALTVSLITAVAVFHIGRRIGGTASTGLWSALFFALLPFEAWIFHVEGHLDFNLQVAWFAILLLVVLRAMDADHLFRAIELGFVASTALLFNPGFLLCTAIALPFLARSRATREFSRLVGVVVLVHLAVVGPYVAWQSLRLEGFVPVKSNGGFEIALGNLPSSEGVLGYARFESSHPSQNVSEFNRYREVGEIPYVRSAFKSFLHQTSWSDFFEKTLRRCHHFFLGYEVKPWDFSSRTVGLKTAIWLLPLFSAAAILAIRRGRPARLEILLLLFTLAYAVPYLVTGIMERYRLPMVTTISVLLALVTVEAGDALARKRPSRAAPPIR